MYTNEQLQSAIAKAHSANPVIGQFLEDLLTLTEMMGSSRYDTLAPNHVTTHLQRAATNLIRHPMIREFLPSRSSATHQNGNTPRLQIIRATVAAFKEKYPPMDAESTTELYDNPLLTLLVEAAVPADAQSAWESLKADEFRLKLLLTDVRKGLIGYAPELEKPARAVAAPKGKTPRQQLLEIVTESLGESLHQFPVDNDDLNGLIRESLEKGNEEILAYYDSLETFKKMLIYADVRRGLSKYGLTPPVRVPKSVEKESVPANPPVVHHHEEDHHEEDDSEETAKPKKARKSRVKAIAETPKEDPHLAEAVSKAQLYTDMPEEEIKGKILVVPQDDHEEGDTFKHSDDQWVTVVHIAGGQTYALKLDQEPWQS